MSEFDPEMEAILSRRRADMAKESRKRWAVGGCLLVSVLVFAFFAFSSSRAVSTGIAPEKAVSINGKQYYDKDGYLVDANGDFLMTRRKGYWEKVPSPQGESENNRAAWDWLNDGAKRGDKIADEGLEKRRRENEADDKRAKRNKSAGSGNLP